MVIAQDGISCRAEVWRAVPPVSMLPAYEFQFYLVFVWFWTVFNKLNLSLYHAASQDQLPTVLKLLIKNCWQDTTLCNWMERLKVTKFSCNMMQIRMLINSFETFFLSGNYIVIVCCPSHSWEKYAIRWIYWYRYEYVINGINIAWTSFSLIWISMHSIPSGDGLQ